MESCWKQSPEDRPTFFEINRNLRDNYISMLDLSEVPIAIESTDTFETEGTLIVEEEAAVRVEEDNSLSSSC